MFSLIRPPPPKNTWSISWWKGKWQWPHINLFCGSWRYVCSHTRILMQNLQFLSKGETWAFWWNLIEFSWKSFNWNLQSKTEPGLRLFILKSLNLCSSTKGNHHLYLIKKVQRKCEMIFEEIWYVCWTKNGSNFLLAQIKAWYLSRLTLSLRPAPQYGPLGLCLQ